MTSQEHVSCGLHLIDLGVSIRCLTAKLIKGFAQVNTPMTFPLSGPPSIAYLAALCLNGVAGGLNGAHP